MPRMTLEEIATYSRERRVCICIDLLPLIPLRGETIRASPHCFLHKIMAEKWDSINSWKEFDAVMAADKERVAAKELASD
jgi:hypothetical protein